MPRPHPIDLLRRVPLFASLSEDQLRLLAEHTHSRIFPRGEALFHEHDPGHTLYAILSGAVNIQRVTPEGGLIHVARRGPGELFGEMSLIDGRPRMADAVTAEASELLVLDREGFQQCIRQSPEVALGIMGYLAERLRQAGDRLESLQSQGVLGRVCEELLRRGESLGEQDPSGGLRLARGASRQEIADEIGSTRESVSRAFRDLRAIRAIEVEGRAVVILSAEKLRRYC